MGMTPYGKAQYCPECNEFGECEQTLYSHEAGEPSTEEWSCNNDKCAVTGWTIAMLDVQVSLYKPYLKVVK